MWSQWKVLGQKKFASPLFLLSNDIFLSKDIIPVLEWCLGWYLKTNFKCPNGCNCCHSRAYKDLMMWNLNISIQLSLTCILDFWIASYPTGKPSAATLQFAIHTTLQAAIPTSCRNSLFFHKYSLSRILHFEYWCQCPFDGWSRVSK